MIMYKKSIQDQNIKENNILPIIWVDFKGNILRANTAAQKSIGYSSADIMKLSIYELDMEAENTYKENLEQLKIHPIIISKAKLKTKYNAFCNAASLLSIDKIDQNLVKIHYSCSYDKNQSLEQLNAVLMNKIESLNSELETYKNIEQNYKIYLKQDSSNSNKFNEMNRLLNSIAHHWRQPLNVLGLMVQDIKEMNDLNILKTDDIDEFEDSALKIIMNMSDIINKFSNYYSDDSSRQYFDIEDIINFSIEQFRAELEEFNIKIEFCVMKNSRISTQTNQIEICSSIIYGNKENFQQVIVNIIKNAVNAVKEKCLKDPEHCGLIKVNALIEKCEANICISDNGTGIQHSIADQIFDPYFTTRFQNNFTGLGLYVSKLIIENCFNGNIVHNNIKEGAEFIINIPCSKQ